MPIQTGRHSITIQKGTRQQWCLLNLNASIGNLLCSTIVLKPFLAKICNIELEGNMIVQEVG